MSNMRHGNHQLLFWKTNKNAGNCCQQNLQGVLIVLATVGILIKFTAFCYTRLLWWALFLCVLQRAHHTRCSCTLPKRWELLHLHVSWATPPATLSLGVGLHVCSKRAGKQCVGLRGTPAHTRVRHKEPDPLEQWAQTSENCPSDSARVRGANQAPGNRSQATALVVDTAGLLHAQGQRGIKSVWRSSSPSSLQPTSDYRCPLHECMSADSKRE